MTDPLDQLRDRLGGPEMKPDPDRKRASIEAAMREFDRLQENAPDARPTHNRNPIAAFVKRSLNMLSFKNPYPALAAGSALAVAALAVVIIPNQPNPTRGEIPMEEIAAPPVVAQKRLELRERLSLDLAGESRAPGADGIARPQAAILPPRQKAPAPHTAQVTEAYPEAEPNGLKVTLEEPVSTFSIDVDTTSYALLRNAIESGFDIPDHAIRVEELINYFDYDYPMPARAEAPFSVSTAVTQTPWNDGTQLLQIGVRGYDIDPSEREPMALVFLIDTSGSMQDANKLPLLVRSFKMMLDTLRPDDTIAIVTYAGSAGVVLEPTQASEERGIIAALDRLHAGGSTAGQAGLQQAYQLAETMAENGRSARVILATDGDFNVGISSEAELTDFITDKRNSGVFLSVLGFGRGNYDDATMQALAQNGNGVAAYIDTLSEAQKVLVEDVSSALVTIATNVKIQVEFNPARISEYRLLGYETRALNREDFNDDRVDAGDIGAGHTVTAIYEITPKGSDAELTNALRYQADTPVNDASDELAFVRLRYVLPDETESRLIEVPVLGDTGEISSDDANFAAAVAGFGQLMRGQDLMGWTKTDAAELAQASRGADPFGYRTEFVRLARTAAR